MTTTPLPVDLHRLGAVTLTPSGPVEAGQVGTWRIELTVGIYGIDEGGTLKIAQRLVLFLVPSGDEEGGALLDWNTAIKIPWGVFIMIGGGMAIGQAFQSSGLGERSEERWAQSPCFRCF